MSFLFDCCVIGFFVLYWYVLKKYFTLFLSFHSPNRIQTLCVACIVLLLRGSIPFHSSGLHKVISHGLLNEIACPRERFLIAYRMMGMGMSWTLFLGYPAYCVCEKIGAGVTASLGAFVNTLAYITLVRSSFYGIPCAIFLLALSHALFMNCHAKIAFLFPQNCSMIITFLGIAAELSVYGPWFFEGLVGEQQSFYFLLTLATNIFCLACDMWILEYNEFEMCSTCKATIKKMDTCVQFQENAPENESFVSELEDTKEEMSKTLNHDAKRTMGAITLFEQESNAPYAPTHITTRTSNDHKRKNVPEMVKRGSCLCETEGQEANSVKYMGFARYHRPSQMNNVEDREIKNTVKYGDRSMLFSWYPVTSETSKQPSASEVHEAYNRKRRHTGEAQRASTYPDDCGSFKVFILLLVFFTLAFSRKKFLLFEIQEYLFDYNAFGSLMRKDPELMRNHIQNSLESLHFFLGLWSTGFFYWSAVYCHFGLIKYMLLSNFAGFLALLSLYFSPSVINSVSTFFFLVYQSSISGFPLAAYGCLLNWSDNHVHFCGALCLGTSIISLVQDMFSIYRIKRSLHSMVLVPELLLILSGAGFAAPLVFHLLEIHDFPKQRRRFTSLPVPRLATGEACCFTTGAPSHGITPLFFRHHMRYIPLFQYFYATQIVNLQYEEKHVHPFYTSPLNLSPVGLH